MRNAVIQVIPAPADVWRVHKLSRSKVEDEGPIAIGLDIRKVEVYVFLDNGGFRALTLEELSRGSVTLADDVSTYVIYHGLETAQKAATRTATKALTWLAPEHRAHAWKIETHEDYVGITHDDANCGAHHLVAVA